LRRNLSCKNLTEKFHHSVYVILLKPAVAEHPSILRRNPNRDPAKPCLYVGMTGLPIEHRFENQKNGYKSAWTVKKYGIRLMPELYEHLNPMPFEAAQMEKAEDLRGEGVHCHGGNVTKIAGVTFLLNKKSAATSGSRTRDSGLLNVHSQHNLREIL
jgi:hypothetical protein